MATSSELLLWSLIIVITFIQPSNSNIDNLTGRVRHWDQRSGLRDEDGRADGLVTRGQLRDHQPRGVWGVRPQGAEEALRIPDHREHGAIITGHYGDIPVDLTRDAQIN